MDTREDNRPQSRARARTAASCPPQHTRPRRHLPTASPAPRRRHQREESEARRRRWPNGGRDLAPQIPPARETQAAVSDLGGTLFERTTAEAKCVCRCDGMGAGAGQVLAEFGPTARGAWGRPRTVDSKCSDRCSSTLLSSAPPQSHRSSTLVPHLRETMRRTCSEHIPRAASPSAAFPWLLGAGRRGRSSSIGHNECRNP